MHQSFYLYKNLSPQLKTFSYINAILHKLECADNLLADLLAVHYTERDFKRIAEVQKAISFNNTLLKEVTEL